MSDLSIGAHQTLHEISPGNSNFRGNVHVQSHQGDFMFSHPTQQELDNGNINFQQSKGGHATIPISEYRTGMIALKSQTPMNIRMWADQISKIEAGAPHTQLTSSVSKTESASKSDRNLSFLLWVGVIVVFICIFNSRKK
jgi:hypothetical protein